jgi:hypothetical protein
MLSKKSASNVGGLDNSWVLKEPRFSIPTEMVVSEIDTVAVTQSGVHSQPTAVVYLLTLGCCLPRRKGKVNAV